MRFAKPLDDELLHEVFQNHGQVLTVEDGAAKGGFGSAVLEFMAEHNYQANTKRLGIPDEIIEHGDPAVQQSYCGFDKDGILNAVNEMIGVKPQATSTIISS